jgi:type I restriction-modification system DNA methylase subunit
LSEELIQRNLVEAPEKMGTWNFYNIGSTTLKALKAAKIIPNRDYEEFEAKKPDSLIVKKPQVLAAVEWKQPQELKTKKQIENAISQEIGVAVALGAKIYIVTDGKKTFWINPLTGNQIKTEDGNAVSLQFNKDDIECVKFINKAVASISATNDNLLASVVVDPLPLAQRVWQDLWSVSGATPENCLYTFVEIFIFKYLSDLGVLKGIYSFPNLLAQYSTNSENEVIEFYASTVRVKIKELFPGNPKDKTTIINGTIFVSKDDRAVAGYATVFKKILNRFNDFGTLENIDYDFKSKLFETFLKESISKKNWGQFFTPLKVVRSIVSMADIAPGMKICDPACGVGKFLLEPILHDLYKFFTVESGTLKPQITLSGFDKGFDKDEQKTIILAKANMLIYLSNLIKDNADLTKQFAQLFNDTFLLQTNSILGTLARPVENEYDLILTNPPYVMSGSSNLKEEISKQDDLKQHFSISAMGIEGLFMEWIIRALKPGGKAFVVVPDGIMNRSNDKRLRDFILEECVLDAVISLPLNTFFTTNKKTYIMALTKRVPMLSGGVFIKERQNTPVFTYLCSEIGETHDVYRFDIEQNDLDNATTLFNMFKGVRGVLPIEDKRCKIVSIDNFYDGTHWSVERWWSRKEKVELGIEDENISVAIEDFVSMLGDVSNTLLEYQDLISGSQKKMRN